MNTVQSETHKQCPWLPLTWLL